MTAAEVTNILADEAARLGATADDKKGIVRELVDRHGLGFFAWFCVCCELADRDARKLGYDNQVHRALTLAQQTIEQRRSLEESHN